MALYLQIRNGNIKYFFARHHITGNKAHCVKAPKMDRKEALFLNDKEAQHLIELLDNEPVQYKAIITLLLYTGLRMGQLYGLGWEYIDFSHKTISINRTLQYLPLPEIFTTTKNYSSERTIIVSQTVIDMLTVYKSWQSAKKL